MLKTNNFNVLVAVHFIKPPTPCFLHCTELLLNMFQLKTLRETKTSRKYSRVPLNQPNKFTLNYQRVNLRNTSNQTCNDILKVSIQVKKFINRSILFIFVIIPSFQSYNKMTIVRVKLVSMNF